MSAVFLDFNGLLSIGAMVTGGLWALDAFLLKQRRAVIEPNSGLLSEPKWAHYARYFFPIFMTVLFLRVCLYEPYRIPSGSMKPTVFEGEFILVNKYRYGLRLPLTGTQVVPMSRPKRGDVMVFRYPPDTDMNFIKRVVGLPGDVIRYQDKVLYINDEPLSQTFISRELDKDTVSGQIWRVNQATEQIFESDRTHPIWIRSGQGFDMEEVTVPEGHYFTLGDNRDNSGDSRIWGFVPDQLIIGQAILVWMSWDTEKKRIRWSRIGEKIS